MHEFASDAELDLRLEAAPLPALTGRADSEARRSIDSMVDLALRRGNASSIGDLIDQVATLRQYKPFNALLAVLQRPRATMLLSEEKWEARWRRPVRLNEHPIVLLVPGGPVMFLFDASQTEDRDGSRRLPALHENPFAMNDVLDAGVALSHLVERIKSDGVRVSGSREGWRSAGCIQRAQGTGSQLVPERGPRTPARSVRVRWEVFVNDVYNATERLATLAHELGHLYCGHVGADHSDKWPDRRELDHQTEEFEAESVARLVFRRIAPTAQLPPYLENILDPDLPVPERGWSHVVRAAERVLDLTRS